jgi:hypothetical protein
MRNEQNGYPVHGLQKIGLKMPYFLMQISPLFVDRRGSLSV